MKKLNFILIFAALIAFATPALAQTKTSALSACTTLAGTEYTNFVQSGGNCKQTLSGIKLSVLNTTTALNLTNGTSTSFTVGPNGTTNPGFQVDSSTASAATGIDIISAAAGGGVNLQVISSGTDEPLNLTSKGAGNANLNTGTTSGSSSLMVGGSNRIKAQQSQDTFTVGTTSTASTVRFAFQPAADTALTASTEAPLFQIAAITRTHATGADALQRDVQFLQTTHAFVGASTLTKADTVYIAGAPLAGTNATLSNGYALELGAGPMLVANNYEATIGGNVASATTIAPTAMIQHVTGTTPIVTITPPPGMNSTTGGCITLIADAAWTTTTAGNIFAIMTAVAGTPYQACYEGSKWYIK